MVPRRQRRGSLPAESYHDIAIDASHSLTKAVPACRSGTSEALDACLIAQLKS
jgi:hypothetical protein